MSLTAAASGFIVFLLSVQGTVHLRLYCEAVRSVFVWMKVMTVQTKKESSK